MTVTGFSIISGTKYWIAVLSPLGMNPLGFRDRCCGGGSAAEWSAAANLADLPTTWTVGSPFSDGPISAFGSG